VKLLKRAWRRFRIRRERADRRRLRVPLRHPELLAGAEQEAATPRFAAWTAELLETEQTAGFIIEALRREQEE
jgi:ABC-type nitrate/sulfonate/bicarbonate transport system permease component